MHTSPHPFTRVCEEGGGGGGGPYVEQEGCCDAKGDEVGDECRLGEVLFEQLHARQPRRTRSLA